MGNVRSLYLLSIPLLLDEGLSQRNPTSPPVLAVAGLLSQAQRSFPLKLAQNEQN